MERVLLDVDLAMGTAGSDIDDGFALALALADPDIALELVTTVNGNTDAATATALTLELLHRLGRNDVAVHRGAEVPLVRPATRSGSVPADAAVRQPRGELAAVTMVQHVLTNPGEITLVAVGPLTNVALALRLHRDFARSLKALVIMGGVFQAQPNRAELPGEFNVWSDPEAAQIVLDSGVRARWVGLDVTLQVRLSRAEALQLQSSGRPFASYAGGCAVGWIDHLNEGRQRPDDSCALHDPLALAAVTHPELLGFRDAHLRVELADRSRGMMVADYLDGAERNPNAEVALTVDAAGFRQLFFDRINTL